MTNESQIHTQKSPSLHEYKHSKLRLLLLPFWIIVDLFYALKTKLRLNIDVFAPTYQTVNTVFASIDRTVITAFASIFPTVSI